MMKLAIILSLVGVIGLVSIVTADDKVSSEPLESLGNKIEEQSAVAHGHRAKRALCDLLSPHLLGFGFNHSLCAAKCLIFGYEGGWCKHGECHCRVHQTAHSMTSACGKCIMRKRGNLDACSVACRLYKHHSHHHHIY